MLCGEFISGLERNERLSGALISGLEGSFRGSLRFTSKKLVFHSGESVALCHIMWFLMAYHSVL